MAHNTLITGGAGFIGTNLANALVGRGHRVTVMDNSRHRYTASNPIRRLCRATFR